MLTWGYFSSSFSRKWNSEKSCVTVMTNEAHKLALRNRNSWRLFFIIRIQSQSQISFKNFWGFFEFEKRIEVWKRWWFVTSPPQCWKHSSKNLCMFWKTDQIRWKSTRHFAIENEFEIFLFLKITWSLFSCRIIRTCDKQICCLYKIENIFSILMLLEIKFTFDIGRCLD